MRQKVRACSIAAGSAGVALLVVCAGLATVGNWLVQKLVFTPPDAAPCLSFAVAPDGESIVFSAGDGNLYSLRIGSKHATRIADGSGIKGCPSFSADGTRVVFSTAGASEKGCHLWVANIETGTARQITFGDGVYDNVATFSPDGTQIAFVRAQLPAWEEQDLYLLDVQAGTVARLTRERYSAVQRPHFSSDGSRLVYSAVGQVGVGNNLALHSSLFELELSSTASPRALGPAEPPGLKIGAWAREPALLAGEKAMVFVSDRRKPYHYELFLSARDGSQAVPLGTSLIHSYVTQPLTAPDGESIFYFAAIGWTNTREPILSLWESSRDGTFHRERVPNSMLEKPRE